MFSWLDEDSTFETSSKEIKDAADFCAVYPSEMSASIMGDGVFPKERIPAERAGTEEDMAGTILYMTSRAGAYCNGNVVVTDGGRLNISPAVY